MSQALFFGLLTVEDVWLRQNAPDFLELMRARHCEALAQSGDAEQVAR